MVFDCFTYFNESDLLEFRLRLLNDVVDKFVIAEANLTHSGHPKPYYFEAERSKFSMWEHKIIYLKIELTIEGLHFNPDEKEYNPTNGSWILENRQRDGLNAIKNQIKPDDIILVGDLDEVPDPRVISKWIPGEAKAFSMLFHNYFFNCRNVKADKWWNGTVICSGSIFNDSGAQMLRNNRNNIPRLKAAGWHFSYLGGAEAIIRKLSSFSHTEYNKAEYMDREHLEASLKKGKDVLKRKNHKYRFVPISFYPPFLRENMLRFPQFIRKTDFFEWMLSLIDIRS